MTNKSIAQRLVEITELFWKINPTETNLETNPGCPTVFLDFYGNICNLTVRIYENGWGTDSKCSYQKSINLDSADAIEKLDEVIERMNVCLKTKKRKEKRQNDARL